MKFDEVLTEIGEFGTYQKRLYFLLCLPAINAGIFMVISVFTLGNPDHRCAIPGLDNDTFEIQNSQHEILVRKFIPESSNEQQEYDTCHVFTGNNSYGNDSRPISASKIACSQWVYDETNFKSTFVTQENLVCDDEILPSVAKMIFFAGVLVGALGFGILSDVIGRKKTLYISFIIVIASSIGLSWANSFIMYVVLRFIIGASNAGIFMTGFVIGMELVGPSKRMWAGIIIEYFFAIGLLVLAMVGYFLRDWNHIEMVIAFPNAVYLTYWWFIPESPRWLLSQGRIEEAEEILHKAAKINKAKLPDKIFDEDSLDAGRAQGQLWNLFGSRTLAIRTLVIFFNWMVVSMVYYGLSLNTGNLGGSFYLNFTISGLVEFPAYTLCLLLLDRIGRKWLHCIVMVVGGLACISTVFTTIFGGDDLQALTVTLAMIGKLGAAAAFAVIYVFSAELYPTVVRNAGMGASSCCARIGGMVAPYIADINKVVSGNFGKALPLVIFGAASVAAGFLALLLPETLHKELPESIEDGEKFGNCEWSVAAGVLALLLPETLHKELPQSMEDGEKFGKSKSAKKSEEIYINEAYTKDNSQITNGSLNQETEKKELGNDKL